MIWKRLFAALRVSLVAAVFIVAAAPEWPVFGGEQHGLETIVGQRQFDFLVWEAGALRAKAEAALVDGHSYLDEAGRKQFVLDYLALLRRARELEGEVRNLYADPAVGDPAAAAAPAQAEADAIRAEVTRRQPMAEAIVQEQVAAVLAEEGFEVLGVTWPPVLMHMTALPYVLVVSPREEIRQLYGLALTHGLEVSEQEEMEAAVYAQLDRSALVVPIGGLGLYPSMIVETTSINFLADVVAHEWAHHWLTLRPLGLSYMAEPALRTINETVASIVGKEIGERVIARYYPKYVPEPESGSQAIRPGIEDPPPFDFRAEMGATRRRVDALLAAGQVDEAEAYMEARRAIFWERGYPIRKLNQAYFAFYGAYADTPGEAGADPIGPALVALREESPSLRAFLDRVARVTTFEQFQEVTGRAAE